MRSGSLVQNSKTEYQMTKRSQRKNNFPFLSFEALYLDTVSSLGFRALDFMMKGLRIVGGILAAAMIVLGLNYGAYASDRAVVDLLGRTVLVPENPQRVAALAPNITEIVFALDQSRRLIAVTQYSDFPEAAKALPKIGSYIHLDLERIVALKPDLCIAIKDGNPKEVVDRLEDLHIPVYAVDPRNLETVMRAIREVGNLLHAEEQADRLIRDMQARIDRVKALVAQTASRPRVFFQIGIAPIVSVGTQTFIHELIVMAGGQNLAAGPVPYPRFSREQVLSLAPEVFIITSMARGAIFEQVRAEWRQWPDLPAVRDDRIFLQESNLFDRPTPRLVDGLELLVRMIHPELLNGSR
jgi:iron complex transport system substrate-binding protein